LIEIGQDALGAWAWMLFGEDGRLVQSNSGLARIEHAVEGGAEAWAEAKIRGEPGMPARPLFRFPDGD